MSSDWKPFALPILLGENGIDALTSLVYEKGALRRCRNYHLGRNGIKKREGTQPYQGNATAVNGSDAIQSLAMYDWGTTRHLLAVAGGTLKRENSGAWTAITGAVTIASGKDVPIRWAQFYNGTDYLICGTDGTNTPFKWTGTGNAAAFGGTPPTRAEDICEFMGRVFAINTDAGSTIVEFSDDATVDSWGAGQAFHCSRETDGVALLKHSASVLLALYRGSVHAVRYHYVDTGLGDAYFIRDLVDGSHGAISKASCINFRGYSYFVARDGIYRIMPSGNNELPPPAQYISRPLEHIWRELEPSRIRYISAFARGYPWNEVVFFATTDGNTQHNIAIVFNTEIAELFGHELAWSVFDSAGGYLKYNAGLNFINSDDEHITLLGGYDAVVDEAWGTDGYSTGYKDNGSGGAGVATDVTTGYLGCGMPAWTKGLRQVEMDMEIQGNRSFTLTVYGTNDANVSIVTDTTVDAAGDQLTTEFTFGTSYFAVAGVSDHAIEVNQSSRFFQATLAESEDEESPHALHTIRLMHVPEFIGIH